MMFTPEQKAKRAEYARQYRLDPAHRAKAESRWRAYAASHRQEQAAYAHQYYLAHREEQLAKQKAFRLANPELNRLRCKTYHDTHRDEIRAKQRAHHAAHKEVRKVEYRVRLYGLTQEAYDALFASQGKRCAICKTDKFNGVGPCVDHDHLTGKVRGILCVSCNSILGHAKDNVFALKAAIDYLRKANVFLEREMPEKLRHFATMPKEAIQ